MLGPSFPCAGVKVSNLTGAVAEYYGTSQTSANAYSTFDSTQTSYLAVDQPATMDDLASYEVFCLNLAWNNTVQRQQSQSCAVLAAQYNLTFQYDNNVPTVTATSSIKYPLNATDLGHGELFYKTYNTPAELLRGDLPIGWNGDNFTLSKAFTDSNVHAMADGIVTALGGAVSAFGTENQFVVNTVILETPWAVYHNDQNGNQQVSLNLSAPVLQDLLQNITISMMTLPNTQIPLWPRSHSGQRRTSSSGKCA